MILLRSLCFLGCIALAFPRSERARRQTEIRKGTQAAKAVEEKTPETHVPVITVPLFESRLYDYGVEVGDKHLPIEKEAAAQLQLKQPFTFLGKQRSSVYILGNGGIGFEEGARKYRKNIYNDEFALIAPFWLPNDLLRGGQVWYREVTNMTENGMKYLRRGFSEIRYHYDMEVLPKGALIVTWADQQHPNAVIPRRNGTGYTTAKNKNTIQAVIFATDAGTFANFIYKKIEWGRHARGGFNRGEGWVQYYKLPGLGTTMLKVRGNTGIPGEWMFKIDGKNIIRCRPGFTGDLCDNNCAPYFWGYDCANACKCGGLVCDKETGECPVAQVQALPPDQS